jgi:hypothetical protein
MPAGHYWEIMQPAIYETAGQLKNICPLMQTPRVLRSQPVLLLGNLKPTTCLLGENGK